MKMKAMKRLSSIVLALVMMLAMAMTVSATEPDTPSGSYTMKINTVENHTYKIYQLATGDVSSDGGKLSNIVVGKNALAGTIVSQIEALKDKTGEELGKAALALIDQTSDPVATVIAEKDPESGKMKVASVTLEGGYYVIVDSYTNGTAAEGDSISRTMVELVEDTTVTPKTVQITPDKKILEDGNPVDTSEASIGDTITYRLMGTVPDMTGYNNFKYVMVDTLSKGLTVNHKVDDILTGKYAGKDATFKMTSLVTNDDGSTTVRFALVDAIKYKDQEPDTEVGSVYVDIQATLNLDAVITSESNPNKMHIDFSNNPNHEYSGDPDFGPNEPKGITVDKTVDTYTTELTITKTKEDGSALTGAKFKLTGTNVKVGYATGQEFVEIVSGEDVTGDVYYQLVDGAYTKTAPQADGSDANKYADTTKTYKLVTVDKPVDLGNVGTDAEAFVDADGKVTFSGLGAGVYTISEIVVPDGYNGIKDITFTVTWTKKDGFGVSNVTEGYEIAVGTGGTTLATTIKNQSGTELPSTGGIGTTIFYVVGGILVVGAVVLLVVKKRMSHQG